MYVSCKNKFPGIDIRHFYLPEGEMHPQPTSKGVFLKSEDLCILKNKVDRIGLYIPELDSVVVCANVHKDREKLTCKECSLNDYNLFM